MICPGWTRSPTLTGRSITRPAMRKPSAASSCASMRPVSVTVEPTSRLLAVTVRTGRTSGPRASSAGPQAESVKVARKGNTRLFKKRRGVALRTASNFARLPCLSFRDGERNGHIGLPPKDRREIPATAQPRSPSHVAPQVKREEIGEPRPGSLPHFVGRQGRISPSLPWIRERCRDPPVRILLADRRLTREVKALILAEAGRFVVGQPRAGNIEEAAIGDGRDVPLAHEPVGRGGEHAPAVAAERKGSPALERDNVLAGR